MRTCSSCNREGKTYSFSTTSVNWEEAHKRCSESGGNLATDLKKKDYEHLNSNCGMNSAEGMQYWIGLVNNPRNCTTGNKNYMWVGESECKSANPLKVMLPSNTNCQAVVININHSGKVPGAKAYSCTNAQLYICQNTLDVSTKTKTSLKITTTIASPTVETANTAINRTSNEITRTSKTTTINSVNVTEESSAGQIAAGVIIGFLFLLLLVLIVYICQRKFTLKTFSFKIFKFGNKSRNNDFSNITTREVQGGNNECNYDLADMDRNVHNSKKEQLYEVCQSSVHKADECVYEEMDEESPTGLNQYEQISHEDENKVTTVNILYHAVTIPQTFTKEHSNICQSLNQDKPEVDYNTFNRDAIETGHITSQKFTKQGAGSSYNTLIFD